MGIDLGGVAKGYACDRVVGLLKSEGIENALVNIGGTIFGLGRSGDGKPWRVGLQHPRDPTRTLRVIELSNEAVSTSGDYEQFFVVDGRRYSHILNPRSRICSQPVSSSWAPKRPLSWPISFRKPAGPLPIFRTTAVLRRSPQNPPLKLSTLSIEVPCRPIL